MMIGTVTGMGITGQTTATAMETTADADLAEAGQTIETETTTGIKTMIGIETGDGTMTGIVATEGGATIGTIETGVIEAVIGGIGLIVIGMTTGMGAGTATEMGMEMGMGTGSLTSRISPINLTNLLNHRNLTSRTNITALVRTTRWSGETREFPGRDSR